MYALDIIVLHAIGEECLDVATICKRVNTWSDNPQVRSCLRRLLTAGVLTRDARQSKGNKTNVAYYYKLTQER